MDEEVSRVMREAEEAASGIGSRVLDVIARRVGLHSGASTAFGDPVEREGVTVVPVAKVRWGFGGGYGRGTDSDDSADGEVADFGEGSGGGGGAMASPLGFIELRDGEAEFRRIHDPVTAVPIIIAAGFTAWLVLRGLRALVRR
jgi:uncharacterized spore protein YtfJ